tara:strand:- start:231 stop:881 length:651 start_codon:yes stop_codon:yes gene_type:complete
MSTILAKEIKNIEILVSSLSSKVDNNLRKSIESLINRDINLAKDIIQADKEIDIMEIDIEEECLKILALHQPVAIDLRFIIAVLKINNDLERIGDLSSNISKVTLLYENTDSFDIPEPIVSMADIVLEMLKQSLDSIIFRDSKLTEAIQKSDNLVDQLHSDVYSLVKSNLESGFNMWLPILSVSRYLERIADHCTNIAEDVEYLVTGNITRHNQLD